MKATKCANCRMFYDSDKYEICPHCNTPVGAAQVQPDVQPVTPQPAQPEVSQKKEKKGLFSKRVKTHNEPLVEQPRVFEDVFSNPQPTEPETPAVAQPPVEPQPVVSQIVEPQSVASQPIAPVSPTGLGSEVAKANSVADSKTVAFYNFSDNTNPVVGWLVCIKGEYIGESFTVVSGRNNIGRALTNDIALAKEATVSRERHAGIIFEPNNKQFFIQPGESSGLTYLNGELLMSFKNLNDRDKITLGAAEFMFVQLCNDEFSWDDYTD